MDKLRVSVASGNLKYVNQPLLLGHYRSSGLTGSEALVDALLKGELSQELVGSHLLRRQRLDATREQALPGGRDARVLIIGATKCPSGTPDLAAARLEAAESQQRFAAQRGAYVLDPTLVDCDAHVIPNALHDKPCRVVHVAGHGELRANGAAYCSRTVRCSPPGAFVLEAYRSMGNASPEDPAAASAIIAWLEARCEKVGRDGGADPSPSWAS